MVRSEETTDAQESSHDVSIPRMSRGLPCCFDVKVSEADFDADADVDAEEEDKARGRGCGGRWIDAAKVEAAEQWR